MIKEKYAFESSCGKGRRGCCIIRPDDDSDHIIVLDIVFGLSDGLPSVRSMVSIPIKEAAGELSETAW
jgi:hypothetical protein